MHHLAQNFATEIEAKIEKEDLSGVFGPTLKYKNIYLGNMNGESVSVEEFVEGTFTKYINNDGLPCGNIEEDLHKKAECLSHYSYVHSEKQVMVVDIQGAGYMFDPEIASAILVDKKEVMFTAGNLSHLAINNFIEQHTCNMFCKCLGLEPLSLS